MFGKTEACPFFRYVYKRISDKCTTFVHNWMKWCIAIAKISIKIVDNSVLRELTWIVCIDGFVWINAFPNQFRAAYGIVSSKQWQSVIIITCAKPVHSRHAFSHAHRSVLITLFTAVNASKLHTGYLCLSLIRAYLISIDTESCELSRTENFSGTEG